MARQGAKVIVLGLAQPQRARQRVDGGERRVDGAALFQPDVPVDADAGELGDFFAAQAGRAPPACRQGGRPFGPQPLPARAEEVAEFAAACVAWWYSSNPRIIPGLNAHRQGRREWAILRRGVL